MHVPASVAQRDGQMMHFRLLCTFHISKHIYHPGSMVHMYAVVRADLQMGILHCISVLTNVYHGCGPGMWLSRILHLRSLF